MSIEKLRAALKDFDDDDCKTCQQNKVFHALLDEHEALGDVGADNPYDTWKAAKNLIRRYGESLNVGTKEES